MARNAENSMKNYIGTKEIQATPMNRLDYNKYRGWELPSDENGTDEGYLVEYKGDNSNHPKHEGYISWSPKKQFEEAYRETTGLTFGLAIESLKAGKLVARKGWNGKGMFVFMRPADTLSAATIIGFVKSLPQSLKTKLNAEFSHSEKEKLAGQGPEDTPVNFTAYLCMKAADGSIVNGWLASQTDILAEDWIIVE